MSAYAEEAFEIASTFDTTDFSTDTKRQFQEVGDVSLPEAEESELSSLIVQMGKVYGSTEICLQEGQCYNLEPELTDIMATSKNYTLRTYVWQVCHDQGRHLLKGKKVGRPTNIFGPQHLMYDKRDPTNSFFNCPTRKNIGRSGPDLPIFFAKLCSLLTWYAPDFKDGLR